nr:thermonuclease family protein [Polycladospora coralii]
MLFLWGCSSLSEWEFDPNAKMVSVKVIQIVDGDTIKVNINNQEESVRLLLVDTPETSHPKLGKQPLGDEAKAFTTKMVENADEIKLEFDQTKRDKYDRLLAYVYVDEKSLQEELLRHGLARVAYVYEPNTKYVDEYRTLEKEAQKKRIDIWQWENYVQRDGFKPEFAGKSNRKVRCSDFTTSAEATAYMKRYDIQGMDGDQDGIACENLP